jgi:hypothetical protein
VRPAAYHNTPLKEASEGKPDRKRQERAVVVLADRGAGVRAVRIEDAAGGISADRGRRGASRILHFVPKHAISGVNGGEQTLAYAFGFFDVNAAGNYATPLLPCDSNPVRL